MNAQISVPVPAALYVSLVDLLRARKSKRKPARVVVTAIDSWLQKEKANSSDVSKDTDTADWCDDWIMFGSPR